MVSVTTFLADVHIYFQTLVFNVMANLYMYIYLAQSASQQTLDPQTCLRSYHGIEGNDENDENVAARIRRSENESAVYQTLQTE